ncbi:alpha/beta fold hydrolase [Mucilaginibacter xinganensis]|uniref:2-hydroxy-6-oxononadienedioate/2-hydroxy-6-oxononatrienedioate hydrolase n=1 Tax=Mucilaginibacter xinganensis TaxID=1234841 RepID=A0A223P0G5_9SPHI|nr:alpha/beta hydrolase [Mucilaginibacter xinganensis]ASU35605.1 2-hydroxy-6-oxononadienedioate/2-hydroxy-6-oxononatrienedioate hydrolase [Mucilaginibacter xinganensis]
MKKLLILTCAFQFAISFCNCQQKPVSYGNNPKAGKYYNIRGIKMYCEIYGKGKPLLLIHGNGGSISAFSKTIPYFAKKYKVIAVDSRAHGKSTDGRDSLSFEMMADDFSALLDTLHIKKSYVIGWSDGGINAILLAMRYPNKVIKFASTGANLWPDSTALIPSLWKDMRNQYNKDKDKPRNTAKEKNDWKIFMLDWVQPNIPLTALKAIQCPSLIICGDHDLIPVEHTNLIFQNIKNGYLWVVPNSGHGTLIEHAAEFNKKVADFFSLKSF